jgi:hypothetical protein
MECIVCGLAPCDLPDGVDPEFVFERGDDGQWRCQPHTNTPGDAEDATDG